MKNEQAVKAAFEYAAERYAAIGVDVNEVLKKMQGISLSLHCWQTDDVSGFENPDGELTGGIQATGNYPGKARNIDEVRADLLKVKSLLPGSHRINLHEVYGDFKADTTTAIRLRRTLSLYGSRRWAQKSCETA